MPVWNTHSLWCSLSNYLVMVLKLGLQPWALLTLSKLSILHTPKAQLYFHVPGAILGTGVVGEGRDPVGLSLRPRHSIARESRCQEETQRLETTTSIMLLV